jgi:hypothetical protein
VRNSWLWIGLVAAVIWIYWRRVRAAEVAAAAHAEQVHNANAMIGFGSTILSWFA